MADNQNENQNNSTISSEISFSTSLITQKEELPLTQNPSQDLLNMSVDKLVDELEKNLDKYKKLSSKKNKDKAKEEATKVRAEILEKFKKVEYLLKEIEDLKTANEEKQRILEDNIKKIRIQNEQLEHSEENNKILQQIIKDKDARIIELEKQLKEQTINQHDISINNIQKIPSEENRKQVDSDSSLDDIVTNTGLTPMKKIALSEPHSSTPIQLPIKELKYNEHTANKMSIDQLADTFAKLYKSKGKDTTEESKRYLNKLMEKIKSLMTLEEKYREKITEQKKVIENLKNDITELNKHQQQATAIDNSYIQMQEETAIRERALVDENEELKKLLQEKQEELEEYGLQNQNEQEDITIAKQYKIILNKLQNIQQKTDQLLEQKEKNGQQNQYTPPEESNNPSYSEITSNSNKKNPSQYSQSAIILRKNPETKMSLNTIRTILNQETKNIKNLPKIRCDLARNKNTLIIKTETDEDTSRLLVIIENIPKIKELANISYSSQDEKKVIILGIPKIIETNEVIEKLNHMIQTDIQISTSRIIQKSNSNMYQMVIQLEDSAAKTLLMKNKILLGFNVCRIEPYRPIIRCSKCQGYGHTPQTCRGKHICMYCRRLHKTETCQYKDQEDKHKCANCIHTEHDFPHSSNSPSCPVFQHYLYQRSIFTKNKNKNSIN